MVAQCSGGLGWRVSGLQPLSHNVHNLSNAAEVVSVAAEALITLPSDMTPPHLPAHFMQPYGHQLLTGSHAVPSAALKACAWR